MPRLVPEQQFLETVEVRLGAHDVLDLHGPSVDPTAPTDEIEEWSGDEFRSRA